MNTDQQSDRQTHSTREGHHARLADALTDAPIDVEVPFSRCMRNVAFAMALLEELKPNGKQQVKAIALHITSEQPLLVAEVAHALKGAAAIIGAETLRGKAELIEEAGRAGRTSHLPTMARDLESEMDRCLSFIPVLQADLQQR